MHKMVVLQKTLIVDFPVYIFHTKMVNLSVCNIEPHTIFYMEQIYIYIYNSIITLAAY